jgi:putative transcriptional regulator
MGERDGGVVMGFEFQEGETLTGMVLVATPELLDPNFNKTVVYIVEHGAAGALGMVMNRPLGKKLWEATKDADLPESLRELPVFEGGPVKPTSLLFARFERGDNDEEVRCEIVTDPTQLRETAGVRAFAGYSGWAEGQLERELTEKAWKVCRPHTALLEEPVPPALWPAFVGADQRWRKLQSKLPKNTGQN